MGSYSPVLSLGQLHMTYNVDYDPLNFNDAQFMGMDLFHSLPFTELPKTWSGSRFLPTSYGDTFATSKNQNLFVTDNTNQWPCAQFEQSGRFDTDLQRKVFVCNHPERAGHSWKRSGHFNRHKSM